MSLFLDEDHAKQRSHWIIPSSAVLRGVALVRTDVSEERIAFIIKATGNCELGTTLAVTSCAACFRLLVTVTFLDRRFFALMMEAIRSSETSVPTKATRYNIPEYGILRVAIMIVAFVVFLNPFRKNKILQKIRS
jgi:hypothetical protein